MKLSIDQQTDGVVISLPLKSARHSGRGSKPTTIAGDEQIIQAVLDGQAEWFRVRVSVDYHKNERPTA